MTANELQNLSAELDEIRILPDNNVVALAELRSVLSSVIDHLIFRQMDLERNRR